MTQAGEATLSRRALLRLMAGGIAATGFGSALSACVSPPLPPTPVPTVDPSQAASAAPTATPTSVPLAPPTLAAEPLAPPAAPSPMPIGATAEPPPTSTPAASATPPTPTATPTPDPAQRGETLTWWWWGAQEAPGLSGWVKQSVEQFGQRSGVSVEATLQGTSMVIPQFQAASATRSGPDLQFLWSGVYHMESVWLGYLEPLDGLIPADLLRDANPSVLSRFDGKQWRLGWYAVPMLWAYNKELFEAAGLDPERPPTTFSALLDACEALKAKEIVPIAGGLRDGFWGEWQLSHALTSFLDSPAEALNLFLGKLDWDNPRYWAHWVQLEQLWNLGYLNDNLLELDIAAGIARFNQGQAAMTALTGPLFPASQRALGPEKVRPMRYPSDGRGRMANRPILDVQGLGISSRARDTRVAADLLTFLHSPERVQALYEQARVLPADQSWAGGEAIADVALHQIWSEWVKSGDSVPYVSNLMPTLFWSDAMFVPAQRIIAGEYSVPQAAEHAREIVQDWRDRGPDLYDRYLRWGADLTL